MRISVLSIPVLLSVGALHAAPTDVSPARAIHLTLVAGAGGSTAGLAGTVTIRPMMGPQSPVSEPIGDPVTPLTFSVPPGTMWETSVVAPGWWAAPVSIMVQDSDVDLPIRLLRTGSVAGRLTAPKDDPPPKRLSMKVDVPPGITRLPGPPSTEIACSVSEDASFLCELPAGTLDLSVRVPGYVPIYQWGVRIEERSRTDLGALQLSSGSAVTGFVRLRSGKPAAGKGSVTLFTPTMGNTITALRLTRPIAAATIAENGFFQVRDVAPGRYTVVASYPGFASEVVEGIQVYARVEAKLRPIQLQPPVTVTLNVVPARDFGGQDWHVQVLRASSSSPGQYEGPIFQGAMKNGSVTLESQQAGRYRVEVTDGDNNPFSSEEFVTSGGLDESHTFKVEAVKVRGTLRKGDRPLEAAIWFGGQFGDRHVRLQSNSDGEFRGVIPRAGHWDIQIDTPASTTALSAEVARDDSEDGARVDLSVPANRIAGTVVDPDGKPLPKVNVRFGSGRATQTTRSDVAGQFRFEGVPAGEFTLEADVQQRVGIKSSDTYKGSIQSDESLDGVTLKTRDGQVIHGRVVGRDGPVIGAEVKLRPGNGMEVAPVSTATSGPEGVFDLNLAAGFNRALVVVSALGNALRVFDVAIDGHAITFNVPQAGGVLHVHAPKDLNGLFFFQDDRFLSMTDIVSWMRAHGDGIPTALDFDVSDVAPGRYRVCTLRSGGRSISDMTRCADGFLAPYGELNLSIP